MMPCDIFLRDNLRNARSIDLIGSVSGIVGSFADVC